MVLLLEVSMRALFRAARPAGVGRGGHRASSCTRRQAPWLFDRFLQARRFATFGLGLAVHRSKRVKTKNIAAASTGLAIVVGLVTATATYATLRLRASKRLALDSQGFARLARPEGARLLVVGDSTAMGTGASSPEYSLPGLISRSNPSLTVVNRGHQGASFDAILTQFDGSERFDAVLVMVGGKDAVRMRRDAALRASIQKVAQRARLCAELVVFLPPGNLGNSAIFLPPWNWWMSYRSRRLHALVAEVAEANGAHYVSLFQPREDDPFARHPRHLLAADGLHPSDAGYELWQRELEIQAQLSARLRKIGRGAALRGSVF